MSVFESMDDDVLVYVFSFMRPPEILAMRKVSLVTVQFLHVFHFFSAQACLLQKTDL